MNDRTREWMRSIGRKGERYSIRAVAKAFMVDWTTVRRWIDKGWLTASNPKPGIWRIRKAAIRKALKVPEVAEAVACAPITRALRKHGL